MDPDPERGNTVSDRNPGFTDADAADLDVYVGTCHLCDKTLHVVAIDARFQHMQTAYCIPCLSILIRRLDGMEKT
jgi:hypothetical protein